ncbi:MAG: hypothetical protein H0T89_02605 [Deltaproteobacteria bacterium]|nr:hypothetical protein [Deltaproteobacteria bacterium]MDQ3300342.1 hypothetical protein [Myxococcota bacterium]
MIRKLVALAVVYGMLVSSAIAVAAPRKVLVLPLDGNAAPATRTKLSASLQKMARVIDGQVQAGDATFIDTATAIGCDPTKPACVENVRATLGVDELVYGTADDDAGAITLVVKRYAKRKQPREMTARLRATDPPATVEAELLPMFGSQPLHDDSTDPTDPADPADPTGPLDPSDPANPTDPVTDPKDPGPPKPRVSRRERNIAIGITAGGGVLFILGLTLWSQKSGLQDDINNHPRDSIEDFRDLEELEDKASSRGWAGNIFVVVGLAVGAYGGWRLYRDHKAHQSVTITPTPIEGGAGVTLTWIGAGW